MRASLGKAKFSLGGSRRMRTSEAACGFGAWRTICGSLPQMPCASRREFLPAAHPENRRRAGALGAALIALLLCGGCGYHVAGLGSQLPSEWKTIAIPAFKNDTAQYR